MAKFFVGQGVRVECAGSVMDGMETRIIELNTEGWDDETGHYIGHAVESPFSHDDEGAAFEESELIPILSVQEPCESEFRESLDELMDRCREGVQA